VTRYSGPTRVRLSDPGSRDLENEGRKLLGELEVRARDGARVQSAQRVLPSGDVVRAEIRGALHSITLERAGEREKERGAEEDVTYAYVGGYTGLGTGWIDVYNVETQTKVQRITGVGDIRSLAMHPNGRHLFACNNSAQYLKIDVRALTASYIAPGGQGVVTLSPDGSTLYAVHDPIPFGPQGGIYTIDTDAFSVTYSMPNNLTGYNIFPLGHPSGDLYVLTYGDGDGDYDTNYADSNIVSEAIEVHNPAIPYGGAGVAASFIRGEAILEYYLSSVNGFREIAISPNGERLYAVSSRSPTRVAADTGATVDERMTFVSWDIGTGLSRIHERLFGATNGCIALSRNGRRAYTVRRSDAHALVIDLVDDNDAVIDDFPTREETVVGTEIAANPEQNQYRRLVQIGPKAGRQPDDRVYYFSPTGGTIWAFNPGSGAPTKRLTLDPDSVTFALGRRGTRSIPG
jgi:hypothetical protein